MSQPLELRREAYAFPAFQTKECAKFAQAYQAVQIETHKLVPPRKALRIGSIASVAQYLGIFEIRQPREIMVRLVGTNFASRTGINNTGRNMLDIVPPAMCDWTVNHFQKMLTTPCGSRFISREAYGATQMMLEVVSFPFTDMSGNATIVVSASVPIGRPDLPLAENAMELNGFYDVLYFDIGNGVGADAAASPRPGANR